MSSEKDPRCQEAQTMPVLFLVFILKIGIYLYFHWGMLYGKLAQGLVSLYSLFSCVKERVLIKVTSKFLVLTFLSFYEDPIR